jgi:hypothetical protein
MDVIIINKQPKELLLVDLDLSHCPFTMAASIGPNTGSNIHSCRFFIKSQPTTPIAIQPLQTRISNCFTLK